MYATLTPDTRTTHQQTVHLWALLAMQVTWCGMGCVCVCVCGGGGGGGDGVVDVLHHSLPHRLVHGCTTKWMTHHLIMKYLLSNEGAGRHTRLLRGCMAA